MYDLIIVNLAALLLPKVSAKDVHEKFIFSALKTVPIFASRSPIGRGRN